MARYLPSTISLILTGEDIRDLHELPPGRRLVRKVDEDFLLIAILGRVLQLGEKSLPFERKESRCQGLVEGGVGLLGG